MTAVAPVLGIDGRVLTGPQVGLFHFLTPILARLPSRWPGGIVAFLPAPLPASVVLPDGVKQEVLGDAPRPPMLRWLARDLPAALGASPVDVYWAPHHFVPFPLRAPALVTVHDLIWKTHPADLRWLRRAGERRLLAHAMRKAAAVTTVSNATREVLCSAFPRCAAKTEVVYPGVPDFPDPVPPAILRGRVEGPYLLTVGARQPRKNLARLVDAFRSLDPSRHAGWSLIVVGGTAWGDPFADAAPGENVSRPGELPVVLAGGVSRAELRWLYEHAGGFVSASLDEGFGLPVVEAEHFGLPCSVSDIPAFREIAAPDTRFFDPHDVTSIAAALAALCERSQKRTPPASHVSVSDRFDWNRTVERLVAIARSVVPAKAAAARNAPVSASRPD